MHNPLYLIQPTLGDYGSQLSQIISSKNVVSIDIAAAYATIGGVDLFASIFYKQSSTLWESIKKRWIIGFDYCRTQPLAIKKMLSYENSNIKIFDGNYVIKQPRCNPRRSFHPKVYIIHEKQKIVIVCGSGNLSRNGLSTGCEIGNIYTLTKDRESDSNSAALLSWFKTCWENSPYCNENLLQTYGKIFNSLENLKNPVPTDDDLSRITPNKHDPALVTKLRICRNLWIQAGVIRKNRGPLNPGNQLELSRMTRVFFGYFANSVEQNIKLGSIVIDYNGIISAERSYRFSDNSMEVLALPIPGDSGPRGYDGKTLLFSKCDNGQFKLTIGNSRSEKTWEDKSKAIDACYEMKGKNKRKWGTVHDYFS